MNESDPVPPLHGEAENVGARPGTYCPCGFPFVSGGRDCPNCDRSYDERGPEGENRATAEAATGPSAAENPPSRSHNNEEDE